MKGEQRRVGNDRGVTTLLWVTRRQPRHGDSLKVYTIEVEYLHSPIMGFVHKYATACFLQTNWGSRMAQARVLYPASESRPQNTLQDRLGRLDSDIA
jgi:hypothetical protein